MDGFEFHLHHHESCGFGLVRFHLLRLSNVGEMHFTDGSSHITAVPFYMSLTHRFSKIVGPLLFRRNMGKETAQKRQE